MVWFLVPNCDEDSDLTLVPKCDEDLLKGRREEQDKKNAEC
jgi:hypothetical protein